MMFSLTPLRRVLSVVLLLATTGLAMAAEPVRPAQTRALETEEDLASEMVDGIDRFLLDQIDQAADQRQAAWQLDLSSPDSLQSDLDEKRQLLAAAIGVVDERFGDTRPQHCRLAGQVAADDEAAIGVEALRWPVLADPTPQRSELASLWGSGLMLTPPGGELIATVIVLGDADQTAEQLCGLQPGLAPEAQVAKRLAAAGCRVVVVDLVSRKGEQRRGRAELTDREYLHRSAFELGRTLAGYEVQMTLALVDWLASKPAEPPIGLFGYGEGGMIALLASGLDRRIDAAVVSGFLGPRAGSWNEPLERNFFGLLRDFDAEELLMLSAGRSLVVEASQGPELTLSGDGGAPAQLQSPSPQQVDAIVQAARQRLGGDSDQASGADGFVAVSAEDGRFGSTEALSGLVSALIDRPLRVGTKDVPLSGPGRADEPRRRHEHLQQIDRHTQLLLAESEFVRQQYFADLDRSSLEAFEQSVEPYRQRFGDEVIGRFDLPLLPPDARARLTWRTSKWAGYEVQIDIFDDVFAYGVLLLPADLKPGERRPVVVCQHGLEGRPTGTFLDDHRAYHNFAAKLCESGLIVFAPQNPYIFGDRFRTLQRKAQPLGKSLFSVIVPQHQGIVNWLQSQPYVDPQRIAFYGLSYGGKTAMRVPALVTDYCLSICSADFNEWVLKNASTRHRFSYVWTGEYEIFEWNLGGTFNYAEMAALICPRPFMVERGHFDRVGEDHWVAYEYAKVRHLYAAQLGIGERTEIEWFDGPHTIHGQGTFEFLSRHLDWPLEPMSVDP